MHQTISIAQEYYKLNELWKQRASSHHQFYVWTVSYANLELLSAYLGLEETVYGLSDEIFFSFRTPFDVDTKNYENSLWEEFLSWFQDVEDKQYDMLFALQKDGHLKEDFQPNRQLPPTLQSVIVELERLRTSIQIENLTFILSFGVQGGSKESTRWWFDMLLSLKHAPHIKYMGIEVDEQYIFPEVERKIAQQVCKIDTNILEGEEAVRAAIHAELQRAAPYGAEAEYKQLLVKMVEALPKREDVESFFPRLLEKARQINQHGLLSSTHIAIAHAWATMKLPQEGLGEIDEALVALDELDGTEEHYPMWRICKLFQASFFLALNKKEEAFDVYLELAHRAKEEQDLMYVMEAYRLCAELKSRAKDHDLAFEYALLSLYAGAGFDEAFRRGSTYLLSAHIAFYELDWVSDRAKKRPILEETLTSWIGKDWELLLKRGATLSALGSFKEPEDDNDYMNNIGLD